MFSNILGSIRFPKELTKVGYTDRHSTSTTTAAKIINEKKKGKLMFCLSGQTGETQLQDIKGGVSHLLRKGPGSINEQLDNYYNEQDDTFKHVRKYNDAGIFSIQE